ncbi:MULTISPECIES: tyrosine-type recombinase/integrase [unclassified Duganella]|uniref:tyrosine-type recombinase/integrase n=1 Tax=unclassified Duganella TaxID=2636909 RepID=UPI000E34C324|nr:MULTISPECIES: tyrosine-type recombinase/integrase [unclassified Duganella]RFP11423.1 site-specific integrase [Duganella sp. BJB475]RFP29743.1 site-specific integrase [Duganella sp. BJB476]
MASIRQRSGVWQAQVRRFGYPSEVKSFSSKAEAQAWSRAIEAAMDQGAYQATHSARNILLSDLLQRYGEEVSPTKRSEKRERQTIQFILRHKMAAYSMEKLTPAVVASYRDERLKTVAPATIIRELSILSSVISHARKEWGLPTANPCALVRKPSTPQGRTRLLTVDEEARLIAELQPVRRRSPWMAPLVLLALETAMRRGELLSMRWENVNLQAQTVLLPMTKNGTARVVPFSRKAVAVLLTLPYAETGPVFPLSYMVVNNCFVDACKRAKIVNLHFHDLRHTATSKLAEKLPNVIELAAVTGHQTIQMLKRYYHPKAEVLAQKLG